MLKKSSIQTQQISQFELINSIYKAKLFTKVELKPTAKLVLYALVHHYNPCNEDMFPSQKYIAQNLGISEKSVERAVKELADTRLIMYITKNVNRYKFTSTFFDLVKMSDDVRQNVGCRDRQNVGQTYKHEQKKNKDVSFISSYKNEKPRGTQYKTVQETKILLKEIEETKKIDFTPKDFSKKDALNWLKTLPPALHGGTLAQEVYQKYGFKIPQNVREVLMQRGKLPAGL